MRTVLACSGTELLGDGVMKLPFLRALRRAWPDARITWLAASGRSVFATALAELVRPYLDEVIEDAGIGARWAELLARPLPGRRFDLVLDTQRRVRTAAVLRRIRHRTFVSGAAGFLLSDRRPWRRDRDEARHGTHMVDAMLRLVTVAGGGPPRLDRALVLPPRFVAAAAAALPGTGYVGFAPGAGGRHKCWPLDRFLLAARAVAAEGWRPVFLLGPAEHGLAATVRAACPDALLPLPCAAADGAQADGAQAPGDPRASPVFAIACAGRLRAAVANDSGTGHLLAAADVPLLSLFGPTPPGKFAPLVTRGTVLQAQAFGGADMAAIPVDAVVDGLRRLLA